MVKTMAAILGCAALAISFSGVAQDTNSITPSNDKIHPRQKQYSSWCSGKATDTTVTGVIVGIGGDYWGDNYIPFSFKTSDGNIYTDTPSWPYTYSQAQLMYNLLMASYTMASNITLSCQNGNVHSVWLDVGP